MILGLADRIAANMGPQTLAAVYQQSPGWLVEQIRMYRFRQTVRYAAAHSEFYRSQFKRRGIDARQVRRPADLGDFYTTPDDIVANAESFLCRPPAIVFESSGTTGKNKQVYYGRDELDEMGRVMAAGLFLMGMKPADRVANAFDFSMWIPGMLAHVGLLAAGSFCMAFGKVDPSEVYRRLKQYRFNVVLGEPTWLIRLTELAERDNARIQLKLLIGGAEEMPAKAIPWMQNTWQGAQVKMCYGSVELGSALGYQPCSQNDGYHVDDTDFLPELYQPDADGHGEVVFTTLRRTTMPLIRYRTRDVATFIPGRCPCGLPGMRMSKIRGRRDELVVASGGNLYPLMFENIIKQVPTLTHDWQVTFTLEGIREVLHIRVESSSSSHDTIRQAILAQAQEQYPDLMKNLALGIFQMRISVHPPGSLRPGRKLKRLVDLRYAQQPDAAETGDPIINGSHVEVAREASR